MGAHPLSLKTGAHEEPRDAGAHGAAAPAGKSVWSVQRSHRAGRQGLKIHSTSNKKSHTPPPPKKQHQTHHKQVQEGITAVQGAVAAGLRIEFQVDRDLTGIVIGKKVRSG